MNDMFPSFSVDSILTKIPMSEQFDSKTVLALSGMACLTITACIACISFSDSELNFSKDGLSITHSTSNAA